METRLLIGAIASFAGFACAFSTVLALHAEARKRATSLATQGSGGIRGMLSWRLRNGYSFAKPLSQRMLAIPKVAETVDQLVAICAQHGNATDPTSLASSALVAFALVSACAGAITGSPVGAVAVPACVAAIAAVVAANHLDKRREAVREAVPGALESMSACFGSGFTLLQTFKQVASDIPDPLGATFASSANILEMGGSAEAALAELRDGAHASELAFVAVALDVQHQSGGAMRQVLDAAADTVKGELALRRSLRVQTAQAKLSARVVVIMPFVLVAAFSLASPDFLSPFFASPAGYALLTLALIMQAAGIVLVRRALSVDGVS